LREDVPDMRCIVQSDGSLKQKHLRESSRLLMEKVMEKKPVAGKKKPEDFGRDERGQTQPADKEQAQKEEPQSPGQPAGGE